MNRAYHSYFNNNKKFVVSLNGNAIELIHTHISIIERREKSEDERKIVPDIELYGFGLGVVSSKNVILCSTR